MRQVTLAVIVGHRAAFPEDVVVEHRAAVLQELSGLGINCVIPDEHATALGAVRTWQDAQLCAAHFRAHRDEIDGILVTLPNFGDQKAIADTLRLSGLSVPVLLHARADDLENPGRRGDALCGWLSACNNLVQYGIPFSLTSPTTLRVLSDEFRAELTKFAGVCRVVRGMRSARLGVIGVRPNDFNTVRFSEKLLENSGISVQGIDLSEIISRAHRITDDDPRVVAKLDEIRAYADVSLAPEGSTGTMARLGAVIDDWIDELGLDATAIQCWRSLQENVGVNACLLMSMMSQRLVPSACEADIAGAASMYALQLAAASPSALVDIMTNYGDDPDRCVVFHCGNWPRQFLPEMTVGSADRLSRLLGPERTYGVTVGRIPPAPMTLARISTDDRHGRVMAYVAEGRVTDDPMESFGAFGVIAIPDLQGLLRFMAKAGFEHHAAINLSHVGDILEEAMSTYLGWDVLHHGLAASTSGVAASPSARFSSQTRA